MADVTSMDSLLEEGRVFEPTESFRRQANANDETIYSRDREEFWAEWASKLDWYKPWNRVLEGQAPYYRWFSGGELNVCYNCVDRHVSGPRRNKAAIVWEGEPGDQRVLTYWDLYREVNAFAGVLKNLGVKKGDRVVMYMPMIPELAIALLATVRIGAVHTVVFGGFSVESLRDRIHDAGAKVVVTADGGYRRGQPFPLKPNVDQAVDQVPGVEKVIVVQRVGGALPTDMQPGRDLWWHEEMEKAPRRVEPEPMEAEDMLFILYTSGTTGKPKGVVHTTGGYLTGVATTSKLIFDLKDEDVYWCTADLGWITGHSYVIYGPLANGATTVMYEGTPDFPAKDRYWEIIERHGVTILYTAPTAIRTFMRWGTDYPARRDLSTLRLLGSVGEPINPEAWMWYREHIGSGRCPVVDTWWQTETGMILITPLPGLVATKPGSATRPFPTIVPEVVDDKGDPVPPGRGGYLVLREPWPAMLRTVFGDDERYVRQYWSQYPGKYFAGDGARMDDDGYFWLLGRVDDVINVSGHRIGTMEVESALVDHPAVAEAAVIGRQDELKGQAVAAFVTLKEGIDGTPEMVAALKEHVVKKIGALARPAEIHFTHELPKTRSGKIMRRLLRDIAEGRQLGDTTTLADPAVISRLREQYAEEA